MGKRLTQAASSITVFHSRNHRFVLVFLLLFSILPKVAFARPSPPDPAPDVISDAAAELILGPQAPISNSWFDQTEVARGKFHGEAFPATPPPPEQFDPYVMAHYYDLGLSEYIAYKRTGDPIFLTYARKVVDSWWQCPYIQEGRLRNFDVAGTSPKFAGLSELMLRAMDGRPEMWDWINAYTRYHFNLWLKMRINDPQPYIGIREGAFMLQAAAWLSKVLPDTFPLTAGGTATNGAQLRAQYLADVEAVAVNYFGRLQYPDGSWRWDDVYYTDADGGTLKGIMQPFMVGLLMDALIDVYQVTTNETVKTNIQSQVTKACRHLYSDGPYTTQRLSALNVNLRGFHYFYHGGTTVNPTKYEKGDLPADWNPPYAGDVQNQRQPIGLLVAAYGWSYQRTGDPFFKAAGDDLWDSAYGPTDGIRNYMAGDGKSYNQNCRWAGSYLVWAGQPSTPAPTPTPTSTPTPTPTPTPSPTPSPSATPTPTPNPSPNPPSQVSVSFVQLDTATKGNWKTRYGADGYNTVNDGIKYPSYAQVSVTGYSSPTWTPSTVDVRGLQKATGGDRIAARWDSTTFFTVDLNLTDGQTHRVAIYNVDWDGNNRSQRFDLVDWSTNALLDSRTVSSFNGGQYLVWDIRGHVKISVNKSGAKSAVLSGLYFGGSLANPTPTPTPTPSPSPGTNRPPSVSITSPSNGSTFVSSMDITLSATAADSDGTISRVEFYKDGILIGVSTSSPYVVNWPAVPKGIYNLTARAIDNAGGSGTSSGVSITVNSSPNSVNRAKGHANNLLNQINGNYSGAADTVPDGATLTFNLAELTADIQSANTDFMTERPSFVAANRIDAQLAAAILFSKATASLALKTPASPTIVANLRRIAAHLAVAEDLMRYATISDATITLASNAKARTDIYIGLSTSGYGVTTTSALAPSSIGNIMGNTNITPMTSQTAFGAMTDGSLPYEVAGLTVTVGGQAVPLLYVSPWRISFYMPSNIQPGTADVIVTSQDGYVCSGLANIAFNGTRIMTTSDSDSGVAVVMTGDGRPADNLQVTTPWNFGPDKRTRLNLFATGISGSAANTNPNNDVTVAGTMRANFAESVTVEARLLNGRVYQLPVEFAGVQGTMPGLDQVIVVLIPELRSAGQVQVSLIVGGQRSNAPTVVIR